MSSSPLIKFQTTTAKVKAISFHTKRSWVAIAVYDGSVQVWDYATEKLVCKYNDHHCPVRAIHFHPSQPLIASAGDDGVIYIYNYNERKVAFVLQGHGDYIRSVEFHHELPWIVSGSDDQSVRIWDWQKRSCLAVLLGHHYYVMCARWHPSSPLLASASLDGTVRVWDYSPLLRRHNAVLDPYSPSTGAASLTDNILSDVMPIHILEHHKAVNTLCWAPKKDLLFTGGVEHSIRVWYCMSSTSYLRETLYGHSKPITSISCNKAGELISSSEDASIKLWTANNASMDSFTLSSSSLTRANDKFWATAVSADARMFAAGHEAGFYVFKLRRERPGYAFFDPQTVIWTTPKQIVSSTRFPVLSSAEFLAMGGVIPPNKNDPAYFEYYHRRDLDLQFIISGEPGRVDHAPSFIGGKPVCAKDGTLVTTAPPYVRAFYANAMNRTNNTILFCKGGSYILITLDKGTSAVVDTYTSPAKAAVFVSASRFAVLSKDGDITLLSLQNEVKRSLSSQVVGSTLRAYYQEKKVQAASSSAISSQDQDQHQHQHQQAGGDDGNDAGVSSSTAAPPSKHYTVSHIFPGPPNTILLRSLDGMSVLDCTTMKILGDVSLPTRLGIKRVVWNHDHTRVAIVSKTIIYLCAYTPSSLSSVSSPAASGGGNGGGSGVFTLLTTHTETLRVKSLLWDPQHPTCLVYNTESHLKYILTNGDNGVLATLNEVIYLGALVDPSTAASAKGNPSLDSSSTTTLTAHSSATHPGSANRYSKRSPDPPKSKLLTSVPSPTPYDQQLHFFTRSGTYAVMYVNCIEYMFKAALVGRDTPRVARILCSGHLRGRNIVQYVEQHGLHEVALQIVDDIPTKFDLCLKSGNIAECLKCAMALNSPTHWRRLAEYATRCGAMHAAERGYVNTKDLVQLALLYLITGDQAKLYKVALMASTSIDDTTAIAGGSFGHFDLAIWLLLCSGATEKVLELLLQNTAQLPSNHLALTAILKASLEHQRLVLPSLVSTIPDHEAINACVSFTQDQVTTQLDSVDRHLHALGEQYDTLLAQKRDLEAELSAITLHGGGRRGDDGDGDTNDDDGDDDTVDLSPEFLQRQSELREAIEQIDVALNLGKTPPAAAMMMTGGAGVSPIPSSISPTSPYGMPTTVTPPNPPHALLNRSPYALSSHLLSIDSLLSPCFDVDVLIDADTIDIRELHKLKSGGGNNNNNNNDNDNPKGSTTSSPICLAPTACLPPLTPLYAGIAPEEGSGVVNPLAAWPTIPPHLQPHHATAHALHQQQQHPEAGSFDDHFDLDMNDFTSASASPSGGGGDDDTIWFQEEILGRANTMAKQSPHPHSEQYQQQQQQQHDGAGLDGWNLNAFEEVGGAVGGGGPLSSHLASTTAATTTEGSYDEFAEFNNALLGGDEPHSTHPSNTTHGSGGGGDGGGMEVFDFDDTSSATGAAHSHGTPTTTTTAASSSPIAHLLLALDGAPHEERWLTLPTKQLSPLFASGNFHQAVLTMHSQVSLPPTPLPQWFSTYAVSSALYSSVPVASLYPSLPPTQLPLEVVTVLPSSLRIKPDTPTPQQKLS